NDLKQSMHIDICVRPELKLIVEPSPTMDWKEISSKDFFQINKRQYDFVFIDGDHSLDAGIIETDAMLEIRPLCIMAHDTSTSVAKPGTADGPAHLKQTFQTHPDYFCLEDNRQRSGEVTWRGMFLATRSMDVLQFAKERLREIQ